MHFKSREDAGEQLARHLQSQEIHVDYVLGLPRGGVIVAAQIARRLQRPLHVIVVRKIGHPRFREFAVGALAEGGVVLLDHQAMERSQVQPRELDAVVAEESERLEAYQAKFERAGRPVLQEKSVLLVDDGLATGSTLEAAIQSARQQKAAKITVAIPVASNTGYARLASLADEMVALLVDPSFQAVGQYYSRFPQTTDEEVFEAMKAS